MIPVAHGYCINSAIKDMPFAGEDLTKYIVKEMKNRGE